MNVLINTQYSGLNFSYDALCRYKDLSGNQMVPFSYVENIGSHLKYYEYCDEPLEDFIPVMLFNPDDPDDENWLTGDSYNIKRDGQHLIQVFEEFGDTISEDHLFNRLAIIEIADNANWHIESQDWGGETLVVKTVKIDRDKLAGLTIIDEIVDFLENNPDAIDFNETYYSK